MARSTHSATAFRPDFSIAHTTRTYPRLSYGRMKNNILGMSYCLSLVFIGTARARALNYKSRKKKYVPNVLSFPLDSTHGEIFITPHVARKEANQRGMTLEGYVGYLYIHALLHLKGIRHGDTMSRLEKKYCRRYALA